VIENDAAAHNRSGNRGWNSAGQIYETAQTACRNRLRFCRGAHRSVFQTVRRNGTDSFYRVQFGSRFHSLHHGYIVESARTEKDGRRSHNRRFNTGLRSYAGYDSDSHGPARSAAGTHVDTRGYRLDHRSGRDSHDSEAVQGQRPVHEDAPSRRCPGRRHSYNHIRFFSNCRREYGEWKGDRRGALLRASGHARHICRDRFRRRAPAFVPRQEGHG